MRAALILLAACAALSACGSGKKHGAAAGGGSGDLIPSCYADAGLDANRPPSAQALFVVIDQTTGLDDRLRATVAKAAKALVARRGDVALYTFSAIDRTHYPTLVASGTVETPVASGDRASLSVKRLERLDKCLGQQLDFAQTAFATRLAAATGDATAQYSHSAIQTGLTQISQAVARSHAPTKIVLLVSDMLEHSDITSFYDHHKLRLIDPAAELARSKQAGAIGDFGGARVIVVGAGLLAADAGQDAERATPALRALHDFWTVWFAASNAKLTDYGEPDLVNPIE
ncbi:MAG: hypothetical protein J0I47_10990 [Sphingomonas sp.]|uniref:hypothetical protein n=1 Tax=Sphingomonas sp. TaxID=28214 RepID=UPI001AC17931|nr:hypothetical protein [Sphingomonas sp.]MBN8808737.1 hypothetical protein [Sphingomonas sp.]